MNNNDLERIIDEIGKIDDDVVQSALDFKVTPKKFIWKKYISLVACFVLVFVSVTVSIFFDTYTSKDDKDAVYSENNSKDGNNLKGDSDKNDTSIFEGKDPQQNNSLVSDGISGVVGEANSFDDTSDESDKNYTSEFDDSYYGSDSSNVEGSFEEDEAPSENISGSGDLNYGPDSSNAEEDESPWWDISGGDDGMSEGNFSSDIDSSFDNTESSTESWIPLPPTENKPTIPSLTENVEIDDLNKLAYYSGWLLLKKSGYDEKALLSASQNNSKVWMSESNGYGFDVSESDIPNKDKISSNKNSEFVPIDPEYSGEIFAYAVYEITVHSVEYFKIHINSGYLADRVGTGEIEVMIMNVDIGTNRLEHMVVFRNGDKYFSCVADNVEFDQKGSAYRFTASKYVSNFSIVYVPESVENVFEINLNYKVGVLEEHKTLVDANVTMFDNSKCYIDKNSFCEMKYAEGYFVTASGLTEKLSQIYYQ